MRDNMEASAEDLHQLVLQNAFKSMSSLPEKVVICGKNNKVVAFNRDIMMLFSSFIRDMLSNIPCCTTNATNPIIILPEVHISTLIKLQDILHNGYCDEISDVLESNELLETTNLLGFNIKKLHVENKKKIGDKEAFINVDNVNMSKKEVRNLITQRQKEGNQVVLMRNSKAALPSLPASKLKSNMVKKAATPSSATSKISTKPPAPKPSPLPSKTPSITTPVNKTTTPSLEAAASTSASSMISPLSVPVKTEAPDEVVQPKTTESMEVDQITGNGGGGATAEKPQSLQISAPIIAKVEDTTVFQCEQCNKPFSTVILLKYHYCSHFMNLMKKNYGHLLDSKNSCQECKKNFQNSRRLLLHIGVNHDKINDILKSRGFKTLPPHSSSPPPPFSSSSSTNNSTDQPKEATKPAAEKVFDVRKMMDIKNVPLITPPATPTPVGSVPSTVTEKSKTISTETFKTISDPVNSNPKVMPSPGSSKPMSSSAPVQPPGPSATPSSAASKPDTDVSKSQDTSQCNYDLECQVCKQKMNNLHQLEQHCCRHFMKVISYPTFSAYVSKYSFISGVGRTICQPDGGFEM